MVAPTSEEGYLLGKSDELVAVLPASSGFKVISATNYHHSQNFSDAMNDRLTTSLLNISSNLSESYLLFNWALKETGVVQSVDVELRLPEGGYLGCLEEVHRSIIARRVKQFAQALIISDPLAPSDIREGKIIDALRTELQAVSTCCDTQSDACNLCLISEDVRLLFPSVDHQSVYSDTGSVTPVIGVISSSGANYVFTQTDSIEISWNGQEVPIQEIIANYLTSYGSEVQWDVLITGNEICEIDDQLAVQNFFNPDISLARPGKDVDESLKSLTSDLSHKLYVYLNEDGGLEFQMSTSGDLYHPVDFTIVNASRLGLYDSYPTLSIDKSRNFNGPLPRTDATHFAGYTPSGSLISFPYGTIIGFYPGDGGEWPAGSVGGFQIGGEVYWGAWDNTPSRKTFLGYICQAGMGVADPCNPVLNPTFYLPTSNQASGEMVVHGTVVAARLGNPDTCSIYVYQSEWNDEALEILHVNVDRAESAVADQIVDFIPVPENAYEGVGTMSNPHCLDANGLCRVEAQYHPYLVGGDNNPIFRALQNNPCLGCDAVLM
jgi:hypothetical protein